MISSYSNDTSISSKNHQGCSKEQPCLLFCFQLILTFWNGKAVDSGVIHKTIEVSIHPYGERPQPWDDPHGARAVYEVYNLPADLLRSEQHKSRCCGIRFAFDACMRAKFRSHAARIDHRDINAPRLDFAPQCFRKSMHSMLARGINCVCRC